MKTLRRAWSRLKAAARPEPNLAAELETHLQMQTEDNLRAGMSPEQARREALLKFGPLESTKESLRDQRTLPGLESLFKDLAYALRILRKSPGFAAVAILTLALGIGANTAIFSVLNGVLLQPLPYPNPDRIVTLNTTFQPAGRTIPRVSGGDLLDLQSGNQSFDAIGYYMGGEIGMQIGNRGEFAWIYSINPDLLRVFSMTPVYGRLLTETDAGRAAVVSLPFATRAFGSGPAALGQTISVDKQTYEIAGILPAAFEFPNRTPNRPMSGPPHPRACGIPIAAPITIASSRKLKPGLTPRAAEAQLTAIAARLSAAFPDTNRGKTFSVRPLRDQLTGPVGSTLWVLMAVVSLVLLDLLRQRRQSPARARRRPLPRNRPARRPRSQPLAHPPPTHPRKPAPRRRGRSSRPGHRRRRHATPPAPRARKPPAPDRSATSTHRAPLRRRGLAPRDHPLRPPPRLASLASRSSRRPKTRRRARPTRPASQPPPRRPGDRGSLALRHARRRSRPSSPAVSSRSPPSTSAFTPKTAWSCTRHIPTHGLDETIRVAASIDTHAPRDRRHPRSRIHRRRDGSALRPLRLERFLFSRKSARTQYRIRPTPLFGLASPNYFATMGIPLLRGREFSTARSLTTSPSPPSSAKPWSAAASPTRTPSAGASSAASTRPING